MASNIMFNRHGMKIPMASASFIGKRALSARNRNNNNYYNLSRGYYYHHLQTSATSDRSVHTGSGNGRSGGGKQRQKNLFTPSPFAKSSTIPLGEDFVIHRELLNKEGGGSTTNNDAYGVRKYLLLPRSTQESISYQDRQQQQQQNVIASLHANKNIIFGAKLHGSISTLETRVYVSDFLSACGPLLNVAKEDASMNGQQPQALATLNGLCSWVNECLEKDGEGSAVLTSLFHGDPPSPLVATQDDNDEQGGEQQPSLSSTSSTDTTTTNNSEKKKNPKSKIQNRKETIKNQSSTSNFLLPENEPDRQFLLDAIRAISTGIPRPGHSVVGMGTYRDGKDAWVALAWEYCQLLDMDDEDDDSFEIGGGSHFRRGLEEVLLYKSIGGGEVSMIEHLGHTQPEYLRDAGGAMARVFFV